MLTLTIQQQLLVKFLAYDLTLLAMVTPNSFPTKLGNPAQAIGSYKECMVKNNN